MRHALAAIGLLLTSVVTPAAGEDDGWARMPGGPFRSVLDLEDVKRGTTVAPFELMRRPVTNEQFLAFVRAHPRWRRDRAPVTLAEPRYLSHWSASDRLGAGAGARQPVTWVSWFAADAYCKAAGARLPTWIEWEFAAAADGRRADARSDPAWREQILAWYSKPSSEALPAVGSQPANFHGVQDLHGLVWEWTEDYSALLVSADNREQGSADLLRFCGAGAISAADRENYAVLMRVAMLSSLEGANATANLGFRCAR